MNKKFLARAMAGTLAAVMLLTGLCGCNTGGETPTPTDATTTATTTASDTATTTPDNTTTDNTTTDGTTATDAPTKEPTLQTGGSSFTIDGLTFELGKSPAKLLEHLGKPNREHKEIDNMFEGDHTTYYYDHVIVQTIAKEKLTDEVLFALFFTDDHYSFDGVAVGDTVETLDERISARLKPEHGYTGVGLLGGPAYIYSTEKYMGWYYFFPDTEEFTDVYMENDHTAPAGTKVDVLSIQWDYGNALWDKAEKLGIV